MKKPEHLMQHLFLEEEQLAIVLLGYKLLQRMKYFSTFSSLQLHIIKKIYIYVFNIV